MGKLSGFFVSPHPPIILPEVGGGEEKKIAHTSGALMKVSEEIKNLKPDTIIVITPHGPLFKDAIAVSNVESLKGDMGKFRAGSVKFDIKIDISLTESIIKHSEKTNIPVVEINQGSKSRYGVDCELDHGSMVPLYFVNQAYTNYKLVHITYGLLSKIDLFRFGMEIQNAVKESPSNAVVIASGDLSHRLSNDGPYDYSPYGKVFDDEIVKDLEAADTIKVFNMDKKVVESAGECGLRSFYIMLGSMNRLTVKGKMLSYEGPFGVGYGVLKFNVQDENGEDYLSKLLEIKANEKTERRKNEDIYVQLARESLEHYINEREYLKMPSWVDSDMLSQKRGAFVSLHKDGELRGCIGTIFPVTDNVAQEILRNAVEAGESDPRFYPVQSEELDDIEYSVDVLMEPYSTTFDELDPEKYGIIVRCGTRTGLLLPDLEGVDTAKQQIDIALKKAGISPDEKYSIEKFEVIRHR